MSVLARKILITAAIDGLILSPLLSTRSRPPPPKPAAGSVKIEYRSQNIAPYSSNDAKCDAEERQVEAHGIVGLLTVSSSTSFLIAITEREQVATIKGQYPVYVITNVVLIPLSSRTEAGTAIEKAHSAMRRQVIDGDGSDTEAELEDGEATDGSVDGEVHEEVEQTGKYPVASHTRSSSIGEDVIGRKGAYGRFAERWFSKRGWTVDRRRSEGMSAEPAGEETVPDIKPQARRESKVEGRPVEDAGAKDGSGEGEGKGALGEKVKEATYTAKDTVAHNLTPKLLHTTKLLLAQSRSFYFSYDWDLTRSWGTQAGNGSNSLPLFKISDPAYFWNRHLQRPFIDSGQHGFVLPLMQGFVAQTALPGTMSSPYITPAENATQPAKEDQKVSEVPEVEDFLAKPKPDPDTQKLLLTLVSRRSTRRAGLRYLRRGVDDQGQTANSVETEQLLSTESWDHVFSYLQVRGSIPLFFSQSPYSFKPRPLLLLSEESNATAFRLHFKNLKERYGDVHVISLVEKDGFEAIIGDKYRDYVANVNKSKGAQIGWTWFDFHKECRGMRFENVSRLFMEIEDVLNGISYTEELTGSGLKGRQKGILRTNCMDCLDRTNVVQAGSARRALDAQLQSMGIELKEDRMDWFNIIWADNGDAISKQYASTAALKGDFTRTRKRNLQGALADLGLTMTRYFTNIISDFFTQAAIDFLLGNVTAQVFTDFEAEMVSGDPAVSMRKIRQNAIEISSKIVVADENEDLIGGWTFLVPRDEGTLKPPMVEKVLLLTDCAVYMCTFDWTLEKVSAFERIPLADLLQLQWGTYITSTLASSHTDKNRNAGFVLRFNSNQHDVIRVNTRSLRSSFEKPEVQATKFWALKAMPVDSAVGRDDELVVGRVEKEVVRAVVEEIERIAMKFAKGVEVKEETVVSLAAAKKGTGLVERWGYAVKRLVWA